MEYKICMNFFIPINISLKFNTLDQQIINLKSAKLLTAEPPQHLLWLHLYVSFCFQGSPSHSGFGGGGDEALDKFANLYGVVDCHHYFRCTALIQYCRERGATAS